MLNQIDRQTYIGSSDAAAVANLDPYKTRYQLYFEKTGEVEPENINHKPEVAWGTKLEPVVTQMYEHTMGMRVYGSQQFSTNRTYPFVGSHIDGLIENMAGGIEIKTTSPASYVLP